MLPAVYDESRGGDRAGAYLLRARVPPCSFRGFLAAYEESPDEKTTIAKPAAEAEGRTRG
jgi:hypothetical protein